MNDKTKHALKLALDCVSTLANARDWVGCNQNERWDEDEMYAELCNATICLKKSLLIIQKALAEQTALLAANKDLQNHFDALMNDYKKLSALCSSQGTRLMEYESSHEPESKPWVGLTRDERMDIINRFAGQDWVYAVEAIEAKLREKNGG